MGSLADVFVSVRPDTRGVPIQMQRAGVESGRKFGSGFASSLKSLIGAAAVFQGFRIVTGFLRDANAEAVESIKVGKTTSAIIKSTGGVAKITAKHMSDLSTAISNKTGIDDEAIQHGGNLLLTFKAIRNEVGKNNDIFDRATAAAVDLSAAGFGSIDSASKMLGKALNDPVKGMTALRRAGVTFTQQQQDQVKAMIKNGDVLGAQRLIMKEVESQVGGVAAASATMGEKMTVAWNNMKEALGTALMPAIEAFQKFMIEQVIPHLMDAAAWLGKRIPGAIKTFSGWMTTAGSNLKTIFSAVKSVFDLIIKGDFTGAFRKAFHVEEDSALVDFLLNVREGVIKLAQFVINVMLPAWLDWQRNTANQLIPLLKQVGGFIMTSVIPALKTVAQFILTEVVPRFLSIVGAAKTLVNTVGPIIRELVGTIIAKFNEMRPQIEPIWNSIKEIITGVMFIIKAIIQRVTKEISSFWAKWGTTIKSIVGTTFGLVVTIVRAALKVLAGVIKLVVALIKGDWRGAWNAIKQIFSGVWLAIKAIVKAQSDIIHAVIKGWIARVKANWSAFWTTIKNTAKGAMDWVHSKVTGVLDRIKAGFGSAKSSIGKVWSGLKTVVSGPIDWIKTHVYNKPLVPVWNRIAKLVGGPQLQAYAKGGVHGVEGVRPGYTPGIDNQVIAVGGGEAIMRPEWTRVFGEDWIDSANKAARVGGSRGVKNFIGEQGIPAFAGGGIVDWITGKIAAGKDLLGAAGSTLKDWVLGGLRTAAGKILSPLKGIIDSIMPKTGVGRTVGGIGKKVIDNVLDKIKSSETKAVAAAAPQGGVGGSGTGSRQLVHWHGGTFTDRFRNTLEHAQALAGRYISVFQGGWRPRTPWSGTSHAGDAIDTVRVASILSGLRRAGVAAWNRGPAQGFINHIHGVPLPGFGYAGGSGVWQAQDYLRGGDGLSGGGLVRGGKGGINTWLGEGRFDELVTPLPRGWQSAAAKPTSRPITIVLDLGDRLQERIQGVLDEHDEFHASIGRAH